MPRMVCVGSLTIVLLASPLAIGQEEMGASSTARPTPLPQIIAPADTAAVGTAPVARPAPRVYHFSFPRGADIPRKAATPAADSQVRPAAALIGPAREVVRLADEAVALKPEPPRPPLDEPPPKVGGAEAIAPFGEYSALPLPLNSGWLGGIPTFTYEYCPRHWDDPWQDYCCERCRGGCQSRCSPAGDDRCAITPCCESRSGSPDLGPTWEPTPLPPREVSPSDRPPAPPTKPNGAPAKRRPPRNEIPQQTKSSSDGV